MKKAYISVPISVDWKDVVKVANYLALANFSVSYWNRDTRYGGFEISALESADLVVVMNSGGNWDAPLTKGVTSEVIHASRRNIPIGLAYTSNEGLAIYGTEIKMLSSHVRIRGVAGTRDNLLKMINPSKYPAPPKVVIPTIPSFDRRLLLLK